MSRKKTPVSPVSDLVTVGKNLASSYLAWPPDAALHVTLRNKVVEGKRHLGLRVTVGERQLCRAEFVWTTKEKTEQS